MRTNGGDAGDEGDGDDESILSLLSIIGVSSDSFTSTRLIEYVLRSSERLTYA